MLFTFSLWEKVVEAEGRNRMRVIAKTCAVDGEPPRMRGARRAMENAWNTRGNSCWQYGRQWRHAIPSSLPRNRNDRIANGGKLLQYFVIPKAEHTVAESH